MRTTSTSSTSMTFRTSASSAATMRRSPSAWTDPSGNRGASRFEMKEAIESLSPLRRLKIRSARLRVAGDSAAVRARSAERRPLKSATNRAARDPPWAGSGRHLAAARPCDLAVEIEQKGREILRAFPEELGGEHRHVGHPGAYGSHLFDVILERSVRPFERGKRQAIDLEEALEALQPHLHLEQVVVLDPVREQSRRLEDREAGHGPL